MSTLSITGLSPSVAVDIAPEAHALKATAIGSAGLVVAVTTESQQSFAVAVLKDIKSITKQIESARVAIKAPVLKLGKDIDHAASSFIADLDAHEKRITGLVSKYQAEQARIAREAEMARQAELDRIERERVKAEAEAARIAAEELRKAKTLEEAEAAAMRQQQATIDAEHKAQAAETKVILAPVEAPVRAQGMQVRQVPRYEVLDIREVALHRPDLVRIEPNGDAIVREIRAGNVQIKGLRCWVETVAGVRV